MVLIILHKTDVTRERTRQATIHHWPLSVESFSLLRWHSWVAAAYSRKRRWGSHRQQGPLHGSSPPLWCFEPVRVVRPRQQTTTSHKTTSIATFTSHCQKAQTSAFFYSSFTSTLTEHVRASAQWPAADMPELNITLWQMLFLPMNVHGVGFLRFAFCRKMHNDWCGINFQLQNYRNTISIACSRSGSNQFIEVRH